jgi:hypothetical protein
LKLDANPVGGDAHLKQSCANGDDVLILPPLSDEPYATSQKRLNLKIY